MPVRDTETIKMKKRRNAAHDPQCMQWRVVMPYGMGVSIKSMDEAVPIMIR